MGRLQQKLGGMEGLAEGDSKVGGHNKLNDSAKRERVSAEAETHSVVSELFSCKERITVLEIQLQSMVPITQYRIVQDEAERLRGELLLLERNLDETVRKSQLQEESEVKMQCVQEMERLEGQLEGMVSKEELARAQGEAAMQRKAMGGMVPKVDLDKVMGKLQLPSDSSSQDSSGQQLHKFPCGPTGEKQHTKVPDFVPNFSRLPQLDAGSLQGSARSLTKSEDNQDLTARLLVGSLRAGAQSMSPLLAPTRNVKFF